MIFDTHAHIDDTFFDDKRDEVITGALNLGIKKIINPSVSVDNFKKVKSIGEKYSPIYTAYGIHPLWSNNFSLSDINILADYIENDSKNLAIGEIGLDFIDNSPSRDIQVKCFIEQIKLAVDMRIPILIHCRRAVFKVYNILKKYWNKNIPGIMHAYSGSVEMAEKFVKLGFFISISGSITYSNAKKPIILVRKLPIENIVVETDSPFLTPSLYKGEKNRPEFIIETIKKISFIKNIPREIVEKTLWENSVFIFKCENIN